MSETVFSIFEGVCPDCGAELMNVRVECHQNRVDEWCDGVQITVNNRMSPNYSARMPDDWIASRMAIYQCECSGCGHQFHLEQNVYGDWVA